MNFFLCSLILLTNICGFHSSNVKYIRGQPNLKNFSPFLARNLLSNTFLLNNADICSTNSMNNVIAVLSHPANEENRNAIRNTWGNWATKMNFRVIFFVGKLLNDSLDAKIKTEFDRHDDLIKLDMIESHKNLTLKTLSILNWLKRYCPKAQFYAKVDDDVYVHIRNYQNFLSEVNREIWAIYGTSCETTKPSHDPKNRYYIPYEYYPTNDYPFFLCGLFYFFPGNILNRLFQIAYREPLTVMEDVFLTGMVAARAKVKLGLLQGFIEWSYYKNNLLAVDPKKIFAVFNIELASKFKFIHLKFLMNTKPF